MDTTDQPNFINYIALFIVVLFIVRITAGLFLRGVDENINVDVEENTDVTIATTTLPNPFETLSLQAASAYVFDIREGEVLYEKNSDAQLPLASLTKLMTALVALENLPEKQTIYITPQALAQDGESGLFPFEQWTRDDLIDVTLVSSSNDGAYALAGAIAAFNRSTDTQTAVSLMNQKAADIGLKQTHFLNETGLDIHNETEAGAVGSAHDVSRVLVYLFENTPELLDPTRNGAITVYSLNNIPHTFDNTNVVANELPWLIGSKTGFTDSAGGNLAVVFDAGLARPVAAVVLGSTRDGRFSDIQSIATHTLEYLQTHN